jgi:uncharacterized repeat protein (TIGR01451 family)
LLPNTRVILRDANGNIVAETTTDADGFDILTEFAPGQDDVLEFVDPTTDEIIGSIRNLDFDIGTVLVDRDQRGLPPVSAGTITITKTAKVSIVDIGESVPYQIILTNRCDADVGPLTVVDSLPKGLAYVKGSATLVGVTIVPGVDGRQLRIQNVVVPANWGGRDYPFSARSGERTVERSGEYRISD